MPVEKILELLIAERDTLNRAIEVLQGTSTRRGRTPKSAEVNAPAVTSNRRRGMSANARKAQSKRMKAYWAQRKKQAAK